MFILFIVMFVYVYISVKLYRFYLLSSPYLRVFGDDRVRGTREQMLLMQVAHVELSRREGIDSGKSYVLFSLVLRSVVSPDGCYYNI